MFLCNKKLQKQNGKYFIIFYILFASIALTSLLLSSKANIAISINKLHCNLCDFSFKYITYLGTAIPLVILNLIFILQKKKKELLIGLLSSILLISIISIFKKLIYAERPSMYFYHFNTDYIFHYVKGVALHSYQSFPSGHTATAFVTFFLAAIFLSSNKTILQIIYFFLAFLVAYSRMYLFQHFLIDIFAGALVGILCVLIAYFLTNKILKTNNYEKK